MSTTDGGQYGAGTTLGTRGLWTDDKKMSICLQTTALEVSDAQVARRYGLNANLIFK